jgi:hypothetical protein
VIEQFLETPDSFVVADARDPYRRLRFLNDEELATWELSRRESIAASSRLVTVADRGGLVGFAIACPHLTDSHALGTRVGTIEVIGIRDGTPADQAVRIDELLAQVQQESGGSLLVALVDLDRPIVVDGLQRAGARVYGANSTWTRALERSAGSEREPEPGIAELVDAVAAAYATYRSHYHADPRLVSAECGSVYVEAVRRHAHNGGETCVVRDEQGIVAFATLEPHRALGDALGRRALAEIGIAGVVPRARGRGVLGALLARSLARLEADRFEHVYYGCAADNFVAQSALLSAGGFRPCRFGLRLHWWIDE